VGFWHRSDVVPFPVNLWRYRFPRPQWLVDPDWLPAEREKVVRYLRAGSPYSGSCGYSWCRFRCGIDDSRMGDGENSDGEWVWPRG
jgi:hypothetical protein